MNITEKQYIEQNALGFEGDMIAKEKMKEIISGVDIVIETGTYRGATTKHFAGWCKEVYSIEVLPDNYLVAQQVLKDTNVKQYLGSSEKVLDEILSGIDKTKKIFMFLDAHWQQYNPLLDELKVIAKHGIKPIIAIHDFKVPGKTDLGFDVYRDIVYEWPWISEFIKNIYGENYTVEYNSEATGAKRGIIYIFPELK